MLTSFQIRLFDLATDPSESVNVAAFYPDMVEDILERLRALAKDPFIRAFCLVNKSPALLKTLSDGTLKNKYILYVISEL